jgi:hypothetical protein
MRLALSVEQRGRVLGKIKVVEGDCWIGPPTVMINRRRLTLSHALWAAIYGSMPIGVLTQETSCVDHCINPRHASDEQDRRTRDSLEAAYRDEGFGYVSGVQFTTDRGSGATQDMGCYFEGCTTRFDPLAPTSRSEVLCNFHFGPGCDVRRGYFEGGGD